MPGLTVAQAARRLGHRPALLNAVLLPVAAVAADDGDLLHHRTRLAAAQALQVELRNAVTRREYAPIAMLEDALAKSARQMAKVLERLPVELKRKCPNLTSDDIALIEVEIVKLRNIAADAVLDWDDADGDTDHPAARHA